jgi:hypothetical protein
MPPTSEMGTDPDEDILKQIQKEVEKRIKENFEIQQLKKKSLQLSIPMDSSGGQEGEEEVKRGPQTVRNNPSSKMSFDTSDSQTRSPNDGSGGGFSFKDQSQIDYMLNRDPMHEFFTLTCQSIKLNSPHMNAICTIDTNQLYRRAIKMNIPFFKWANWIEDHLNKELLRQALRKSRKNGVKPPTNNTFVKVEQATK